MSTLDKLDSQARLLLQRAQTTELEASTMIGLLLRVSPGFGPTHQKKLESDGLHIRTEAGDVLTADAPIDALPRICEHDFVLAVQVSETLYTDASHGHDESSNAFYSDAE